MKTVTRLFFVLTVLLLPIVIFANSQTEIEKSFVFAKYSVKSFIETLPNKTGGSKWDIVYHSFLDSDWPLFCISEDGLHVKKLVTSKTNNIRLKSLQFIGDDISLPKELSGLNFDFHKFILLSKLKLEFPKKKITKDLRKKYYSAVVNQNRVESIISVEYHRGGDGVGDRINRYNYNNNGELICVNWDRDVDGGELFNDLFLWWDGQTIKEIFWITGEDTIDCIELNLTQYSSQIK